MSSYLIMANSAMFEDSIIGAIDYVITKTIRDTIPEVLVFGTVRFDKQEKWIGYEVEEESFAGGIPVIDKDRLPEGLKDALIAIPLMLDNEMTDELLDAVASGNASVTGIALAYMLSRHNVSILADDQFLYNPGKTDALEDIGGDLGAYARIDQDEALLSFSYDDCGDVEITKADLEDCEITSLEPTVWNVGGIALQLFTVNDYNV